MTYLPPRQVHLDFHTSEHIPRVAEHFNAKHFAETVKDACVSSVTVFSRCHHGWLYYPSRQFPELIHPNLMNQNLLLEQVQALHAVGVRAPAYITVQVDYQSATKHPEWLIRKQNGAHEGGPFTEPGFSQTLCVNTGYLQYLKAQTEEVCALLGDELDGVFFDIVSIRPCWCACCRKEMQEMFIDMEDEAAVRAFAKHTMNGFKADMTSLVRKYSQDCIVFYNAGHVGPCTKDCKKDYTHFELESLPSGGWGYLHFPVTARYARKLGLDCMGMTGKFHTSWGDFHSLKNLEALEFECFRMLSYGFACSIGDQLEPNGALNPHTYKLIKQVYDPVAQREAWTRPSISVSEAALLTAEDPLYEHQIPDDVLGAAQMLEELALQFDIIDKDMVLDAYRLVILPEGFRPKAAFQARLDAYVQSGGAVIACGKGGLSVDGRYPTCFGVDYMGDNDDYPDFLIAQGPLADGLEIGNEYVIYKQGVRLSANNAQSIMQAHAPYFPRKGDCFCSHRYTPSAKGEAYDSVLRNGRVIVFSHPLFSQYRDNAPKWCKTLIQNALNLLIPGQFVRHNGPSTLAVSLLEQPEHKRYTLHLLSYVPVRKSATIDIIEERVVLHDVTFTLLPPKTVMAARLVPENVPVEMANGKLTIPVIDGYAIVELTYKAAHPDRA